MRLLSKPGAIMYPFEPQSSLQGAFHGILALLVCSNGECKATDKAYFLIGVRQFLVQGTNRLYLERNNDDDDEKNDRISTNRTDNSGGEEMMGKGIWDGVEAAALLAPSPRGRAQRSGGMGIISRDGR